MSEPATRIEQMTPEERMRSLQEFAEERKYVRTGEDGTIPQGPGAMQSLVFGGPMQTGQSQYEGHIPPPSYDTATSQQSQAANSKGGPVKRWLDKRRDKKNAKELGLAEEVNR